VIRISAIICTLDRADYLRAALASLARQTAPPDAFEVIVVDNGSTDHTPAVLAAVRAALPALVVVTEPRQGLSHARNAGLAKARGDVVAFLDDDAEAEPDWLAALIACFDGGAHRPACVGGPVTALWDAPRPHWLSASMLPYLTVIDWGLPAGELPPECFIAGVNIAFDRDQLRSLGGFPTALGRVGTNLLSNEELVVQRLLRAAGGSCRWEPSVRVGHHVHPSRLRRRWFLRRYYWQGVSDAVMARGEAIAGAPRPPSRGKALRSAGRSLARAVVGPSGQRFGAVCEVVRGAVFAWHLPGRSKR
jgi:glucosyl-dolichyl phosphate glucuronosyltransferase